MPGLPAETGAEGTPRAAPASDLRLAWLARRTCTSLAVREEAFARLMASDHRRGGFRRAAQRMRHACAPNARPRPRAQGARGKVPGQHGHRALVCHRGGKGAGRGAGGAPAATPDAAGPVLDVGADLAYAPQAVKPPSKLKKKAVYFAKLGRAALTADTMFALVRPGRARRRSRPRAEPAHTGRARRRWRGATWARRRWRRYAH